MVKKALAVSLLLLVSSFALGVAFLAPSSKPASAAVQAPAVVQAPVPASEPAPAVVVVPEVLIVAPKSEVAPKARPVAAKARPKQWVCGEPTVLQAGYRARLAEPSSVPWPVTAMFSCSKA